MKSLDPLAGVTVFVTLAQLLSFTATAERLKLSRATVSTQISELEAKLGVRLFQRSTRYVTLTEAGRAYYQSLGGVLDQIAEAGRIAESFQDEAVGRIKLSAPVEIGTQYILPALPKFLEQQPNLAIDLDLSGRTVDVIKEGFDLAVRATIAVQPNLIVRKLGTSPVTLTASPAYLARRGVPQIPDDLAAHACLQFAGLRWGALWVMSRDGVERRIPIRPILAINVGGALCQAACEGLGITLLPRFLVGADIRAGRLVEVLPDWTIPSVAINAVYPSNRAIAAKVRRFVGFLAKSFSGDPDFTG